MEFTEKKTRLFLTQLGWAWVAPEYERHNPEVLDQVDNQVLLEAWHAIRDKRITRYRYGPVWEVLQTVQNDFYPPPELLGSARRSWAKQHGRKLTNSELASDFWPEKKPEMVGRFSHFEGNYPLCESAHVCKSYWKSPVYQDQNGRQYVEGVKRVQYDCWRHVYSKAGKDLFCEACWHERRLDFCRDIERVSLNYLESGNLAYLFLSETEYRKTVSKITTHNGRNEVQVNYTSFPVHNGRFLLHDAPAWLGGETLPNNRAALFDVMTTWAATPKGKRAGHGLNSWGEQKTAEKGRGKGGCKRQEKDKTVGNIVGDGYAYLAHFIEANVEGIKQGPKGMKFPRLEINDFIAVLEENGISYDVEGDVTFSRGDQGISPLNVTKGAKPISQSRLKLDPEPILTAPIYL